MKSRCPLTKTVLLLVLALTVISPAYSQNTGTAPQSGTSSQNPSQAATPTPAAPPAVGETQTAPPQADVGNTAPPEAAHSVAWGWLILGFAIGLLVGALAWRRTGVVVREGIRRDRVA